MPGDLEDLLGGLPSSRPSKSSKPRYCKLCKFVWSTLFSELATLEIDVLKYLLLLYYFLLEHSDSQCHHIHRGFEICLNLSPGCLEAGRHLRPWILRRCLRPCQETLRTFWEDYHHPDHLTAANQGIVCIVV